ncbi:hypothetical protein DL766_005283 [Monosporascus sp. MC13-8B]|nr:hypothetical protein DL763_006213 [Monosporascus cannonballus]RYP29653.1 hypothetical protein DL766_005283 [Monosporascus sp. MC13-8B]
MEKPDTSGRAKAPKSRNSEARKEQNRVASRAYREKRKQKLALLDELLKNDARDSVSSVSDETEEYQRSLPLPGSRHTPTSPAPPAMVTASLPSQWLVTGQDMVPRVSSYGADMYDDSWVNYLDRSGDMFHREPDFARTFGLPDATGLSLGSSSQFYAAANSATSLSSIPPIPVDPNLTGGHTTTYDSHITQPENSHAFRYDVPGYDDDKVRSCMADMDPKVMRSLENFASLSRRQQEHVLALIRKQQSQSEASSIEGSMDMRVLDCQILSAPSGRVNPPPKSELDLPEGDKYYAATSLIPDELVRDHVLAL